ncbi:MAG TPA: hypothetical protein VFU55_01600 [Terracidiphilus sp.]|nr:hypothetical protein [Terracidiphilus sp.]
MKLQQLAICLPALALLAVSAPAAHAQAAPSEGPDAGQTTSSDSGQKPVYLPVPPPAQPAQTKHGQPLPVSPGLPNTGSNHRLILKDGTFQMCRKYELVGDRVRFLSQERGDWEEIPANLVDWDATRKWQQNHAGPYQPDLPAMKEAAEIDKQEAAERADDLARMPIVAKGLELPDQDGVFILDTFRGTPELVPVPASDLNMRGRSHRGLTMLNPLAGARADLELDGEHAHVQLHVNDPVLYISLDSGEVMEPAGAYALTVKAGRNAVANGTPGAHSASSGFAIVRVDQRRALRLVGAIHVSPLGKVTQSENVIPATVERMPGGHWLKITPRQKLLIGEYALVEILSPTQMDQTVWDFGVDPTRGDNPGSLAPIQ